MTNNYIGEKDIITFSEVANKMREFCLKKGFIEVHTQDRLSILAACEDPTTVATYNYAGEVWPLPQTGQMWLEYELLTRPELPGVFCMSTSFRNEKNPIPGRHRIVFPMFEFELKGSIADLEKFETELLQYMGFGGEEKHLHKKYDELKNYYGVAELKTEHENKMLKDFGPVVFCKEFPSFTSPFWNMKRKNKDYANKIDVIMYGNETIGSAERSTNPEEMRQEFYSISEGKYSGLLFDLFGKERVEKELEQFLALPFFPRVGGGIGMTRMISAFKQMTGALA
jgi:aspartyl/asparaginyl-tRNA synthetase